MHVYTCVARTLHRPAKCSNVCVYIYLHTISWKLLLFVICFNDFTYSMNTARWVFTWWGGVSAIGVLQEAGHSWDATSTCVRSLKLQWVHPPTHIPTYLPTYGARTTYYVGPKLQQHTHIHHSVATTRLWDMHINMVGPRLVKQIQWDLSYHWTQQLVRDLGVSVIHRYVDLYTSLRSWHSRQCPH